MSERLNQQVGGGAGALAWLRARVLPRGSGMMIVVAYAMILSAIISFVLFNGRASMPGWRFYGTLLALSGLLALNIGVADREAVLGPQPIGPLFFAASSALYLLANWLGGFSPFFPYLLLMLASQAFVNLRPLYAGLYCLGVLGAWIGLLALWGLALGDLVGTAVQMSLGLLFTAIFSVVITRYGEQTARAEALAQRLQAANAALAAARARERELAAAEERVHIAREIHDGLGHHLTVLNVQLQAAAKLIERDPARTADAIDLARTEAQAALAEVRRSVAAMRGTPLDGRTLHEALAALVSDFGRHADLAARFTLVGVPAELPPAAAISLYRAAQEGLTNAQKYAGAQAVDVELTFGQASVRLCVRDDGAGQPANGARGGFGLLGLRERAQQLGGDFAAGPREGGGFQLEMALPLGGRIEN